MADINDVLDDVDHFASMRDNDAFIDAVQKTFRAIQALSREDRPSETRGYVQDRLKENITEVFDTIERGNFAFYVCGLKGMETGIIEVLSEEAKSRGLDWDKLFAQMKAEGRWNLEVY